MLIKLSHVFIILWYVVHLMGCASEYQKAADKNAVDEAYFQQREDSPKDIPYALAPEAREKVERDSGLSGSGRDAAASAALFGLGYMFYNPLKDYGAKTKNDLIGTCLYGDPGKPSLATQCINVAVHLLDEQGKVAATSATNENGDFRFFIPDGRRYLIQIVDRKGRVASSSKTITRSDRVTIFLKP
jgi:hypothetical protein